MAKLNPSQLKGATAKAGIKMPPAAAGGVKAPAGVKVKSPDQMKKMAQEKAKARLKRLMKVVIVLVVVALVAGIVYMVKFFGRQPKDALENAINFAYKDNVVRFRQYFTEDTIRHVENGGEYREEAWESLINAITPMDRPKILDQTIEDVNQKKLAKVTILLEGEKRTVNMRQDDGKWLIDLNVAIDPMHVTLPEEIPAAYMKNFKLRDTHEAWWEDPPEASDSKAQGFLAKFNCGGAKKK